MESTTDSSTSSEPPVAPALGIDFGERWIGLAISDPSGSFALPLTTLERQTDRRALYQIRDIGRSEGIQLLVVGEPRRPDGGHQPAMDRIRRFGERLSKISGLPLYWVDEALTTHEASEKLRQAGLEHAGRRPRPGRRDAVAAQILLQQALDEGITQRGLDNRGPTEDSAATEGTP